MPMQIRRTVTVDNPPTALAEGQLAVEMASTPPRLWVGVPVAISSNQRVQLNDVSSQLAGYLPLTGGTLTGALTGTPASGAGPAATFTVTTGTAATFTTSDPGGWALNAVHQVPGFTAINATGNVWVNGAISSATSGSDNRLYVQSDWTPYIQLFNNGGTTGQRTAIYSSFMANLAWIIGMNFENFEISRYDTLGVPIDIPLSIDRTTGITTLTQAEIATSATVQNALTIGNTMPWPANGILINNGPGTGLGILSWDAGGVGTGMNVVTTGGQKSIQVSTDGIGLLILPQTVAAKGVLLHGSDNPSTTHAMIEVQRWSPATADVFRVYSDGSVRISPLPDLVGTALEIVVSGGNALSVTGAVELQGLTVTFGDPDSGGTGYRCLRVPN